MENNQMEKFRRYLIESSTSQVIDKKDYPKWLSNILYKNNANVRTVTLKIGTEFTVGSPIYDYERIILIGYNSETDQTKEVKGEYSDNFVVASNLQKAMMSGKVTQKMSPFNYVVEIHQTNKTWVYVYTHPDSIPKSIDDKTSELEKTDMVVLVATRGLKPSYGGIKDYRFDQASKITGITKDEWDVAKAKLIKLGYLNSAGAITTLGKNTTPFDKYRDLRASELKIRDSENRFY